jgi:hypothetical protein
MTEEEAKPDNTQPGALQSQGKPEGQQSLMDRNSDILTGTLSFQQTQEQNKMETQIDITKLSPLAKAAIEDFKKTKEALAGSAPEWRLPKVDEKASVSAPMLINPELISKDCKRLA